MPTPLLMPALSPTMTEGKLAKWLISEGDTVKAGMVIAEIETDKATMEVEAVDEGTLAAILIPAGTEGVAVNTPIGVLAEGDEAKLSRDAVIAALTSSTAPSASPATTPAAAGAPPTTASPVSTSAATSGASSAITTTGKRIAASPLARRIAAAANLDLSTLKGTGPAGRIVKTDVDKALATRGTKPSSAAASSSTAPRPASSGSDARVLADQLGRAYDVLPNSGMRKIIASRLSESKQTIPHFYLTVDCVLDKLLALRSRLNAVATVKISVNDFIIRAVALALKKVPAANVSWTDDAILQYTTSDVSVAVATPTGLITPIVKDAQTKTLAQISTEMKDLATRARDGKLRPQEFQGGGFSVSNLGMYGIHSFSAIINPPQACILAVGAGEQRVIVRDGAPAVATVMTVTLSVDHRAVDGAVGAEFLAAFKPLIEEPYALVV